MNLENFEENFDDLILGGHIEFSGVNADGEIVYSFTQKFREENPELSKKLDESIYADIYILWANGFLDMNPVSNNPTVKITEKALDLEEIQKLPPYYRDFLDQIKELTRIKDE